jgi:hypothetical protein
MLPSTDAVALSAKPPVIMLEGRLPVLEAPAAKALGLHDGQVVRPTVEVRDGQLTLVLNGKAVPWPFPNDARMVVGTRLLFRVQVDAQGVARFFAMAPSQGQASAVTSGLPQRLDQLHLRPPGLEALSHLLRPGVLPALLAASPQPEVGKLVDQLLRLRPSMAQLTAHGLRHWLSHSGWSVESQLAKGQEVGGSAKSLMRQIQAQWQQAPDQVMRLLSEAVDDVEAAQIQAGNDMINAGRDGWISMVLPFADADPVRMRFKGGRKGLRSGDDHAPLVIDLHTRSPELGEVWLQTRISQQTQVQMIMWAVQENVVERARSASDELRDAMDDAGLALVSLQVVHGPRIGEDGPESPDGAGRLVDIQA